MLISRYSTAALCACEDSGHGPASGKVLTSSRRPRKLAVQPAFILLALAALFLRFIVPAGWMPASEGGSFSLMPCVVSAVVSAPIATDMAQPDLSDHQSDQDMMRAPCPFATLSTVAIGASGPAILATLILAPFIFLVLPLVSSTQRTPRLQPPSQGPPLS